MKKLNNRQNQVKSLDFSNNHHFLQKQEVIQKSPQLMSGLQINSQAAVKSKVPQKSEINHFIKKNVGLPPTQINKIGGSGPILNPTESTQSFKTSPAKNDMFHVKHFQQNLIKPQTNKAQRLHKKAVSLMGGSAATGDNELHALEFARSFNFQNGSKQPESMKQSQVPSSQTSFYDYISTNNQPGEMRSYQKTNNLVIGDKSGSLLTHQQKQIHNYQQIINNQQLSKTTGQFSNASQMMNTFNIKGSSNDMSQSIANQGFKSFDQRPPLNQIQSYNQSQRMSILSGNVINESQLAHLIPSNHHQQKMIGERYNAQGKIMMQHPQNKYIKGFQGTQATDSLIKKKSLQSHHQRTLSDNHQYLGNLNLILQSNSSIPTQLTNRQIQDLLHGNAEGTISENQYINAASLNTVDSQQYIGASQNPKTTLGSSRQSIHSQHMDERDMIISHYIKDNQHQEKYSDLKNIYNGMLKDQLQKTKQALKLSQFGGPSRKVVQGQGLNGNTLSYRQSNVNSQAGNTMTHFGDKIEIKSTPKLAQTKIQTKHTKNKSQNISSHGTRVQNSALFHQLASDQSKKKKSVNNFQVSQASYNGQSIIQGSQVNSDTFRNTAKHSSQSNHRRSTSDGNQTFISLSNRIQKNIIQPPPSNLTQIPKECIKPYVNNSNHPSIDVDKHQLQSFQKKQISLQKMEQGPYHQGGIKQPADMLSERQSQQHSQLNSQMVSSTSNSHRQVKHQRHSSQQVVVNQSKLLMGQSLLTDASNVNQYQNIESNSSIPQIKQLDISKVRYKNEMIIQDQDQAKNKVNNSRVNSQQLQGVGIQNNLTLKVVEERIETQDSAVTDGNLSPRAKLNSKLSKKIKLAFQTTNDTPATSSEFYKIGKVMGKGAFGKVNLAIHRLSDKFVALKSINKTFLSEKESRRKVMQEFNILRRTRHMNVVRLYESFETQQHIVFVMEICGAGDLLTYVRRRRKLKEDVAKHLFKQIIEGLKYIHSKSILHRDIKLDNILLTSEGDVKICDFGVSKLVKAGEIMTEQCGTPAYIAPEVFENRGYEGYQSDIWSAGVVLYAMLYGTVPFKASNMTELQKQITKCQTTFKDEISSESISLLKGILERDPAKRMTANDILRHPWMHDALDQLAVFTDQEKDKINSEFMYYNQKNEQNDNGNEIVYTDPFTEQMLNSTQNSLIKNASTKSIILAPFNSTRTHIDDEHYMRKSIQDMMIDRKNFKFAAKVKEIDRQYEANNNGMLDNGVYHQEDEDEKEEEQKNQEKKHGSIITSFDNDRNKLEDYMDKEDEDGVMQKDIEEGQQRKKQSEWQKLEKMVIDNQKTEEEEEEKRQFQYIPSEHTQTLLIDEKIVQEVEKGGYPRNFLVKSLNIDELNYATTFYYLLTIEKEF